MAEFGARWNFPSLPSPLIQRPRRILTARRVSFQVPCSGCSLFAESNDEQDLPLEVECQNSRPPILHSNHSTSEFIDKVGVGKSSKPLQPEVVNHQKRRISTTAIMSTAGLLGTLICTFLTVENALAKNIQKPFPLTRAFGLSFVTAGVIGCYCVPLLSKLKAEQILRKEGPANHFSKAGTPTMGGIIFIPVGVSISLLASGFASKEVTGVASATIAFAAIGLLDDALSIFRKHNYGVPGWIKLFLEVLAGSCFSFWLHSGNILKTTVVPLPPPIGPLNFGKWYLPLATFCFASMANGVNLTDGLDGLAAGTSALAFAAMATAVLPIFPDLGVFGASMAGACMGFLLHNRHSASVFMGDMGSLALGGALSAMASCTGLFLPLFIASGVFVVETVSVILQVAYFRYTKRLHGSGKQLFKMAPFHHHLEQTGLREVHIVGVAYVVSLVLGIVAALAALAMFNTKSVSG